MYMKNFTLLTLLIAFCFATALQTSAQTVVLYKDRTDANSAIWPASAYKTWSVTFTGGLLSMQSPLSLDDFNNNGLTYGVGLSVRKQIGHLVGLEFTGLTGGKLTGNGLRRTNQNFFVYPQDYNNYVTDFKFEGSVNAIVNLGAISFVRTQRQPVMFFGSAGIGLTSYEATSFYADGRRFEIGTEEKTKEFFSLGGGARVYVSNTVDFLFGFKQNFIATDRFDNTEINDNRDKYFFLNTGITLKIGSKDKNAIEWTNPVNRLGVDKGLEGRVAKLEGRVDNLERDSDGDGVSDFFDKEPNTPPGAIVDGAGRTLRIAIDTDGDGIPDFIDRCPNEAGLKEFGGCPSESAKPKNESNLSQRIEFDVNSAKIRTSAYSALDQVVAMLQKDQKSFVRIIGHTDNTGTERVNIKLSVNRAISVRSYLVSKGISASRIEVAGYGFERPVASNSNADGRQRNRRVEFMIFEK